MEYRLPRFRRTSDAPAMEVTARDCSIVQAVFEHRFLRSTHIAALVGGSHQAILRRLKLLYHHRYLERPRVQIEYFHRSGSRHIAYGLGSRGALVLREKFGVKARKDWGAKNRGVGRVFLEHALFVSDVMVALELACRKGGVKLLAPSQIEQNCTGHAFRWSVDTGKTTLGVVPDRVFGLEYRDRDGTSQRTRFFLEADRGTMPVTRSNLSQTSVRRKLLAYEATWRQGIHRTRFGFHRCRVLVVTTGKDRLQSIIDACASLESGQGLFLFADRTILDVGILTSAWQTGRPGVTARLLD